MKINGQHIPDLFVPQSAGGQFPKSTKNPGRKLYLCATAAGLQLMQMPAIKVESAPCPLSLESKFGVQQVLCGPFYSKEEAQKMVPVAKQRQKDWARITYDNTRDHEGMVYVRKEKEEKKTKLDEHWPKKGDADFE